MLMLGGILLVRLFVLTVPESSKWSEAAESMSVRALYETAPRGDILDRNGNILATSRPVYSVNIRRGSEGAENVMDTASSVMELLEDSGEDINVTLNEIKEKVYDTGYQSYMPVTLAEDVSADTADRIEKKGYEGVYISTNYVRYYPNGSTASHIIGYMGRISEEEGDIYTAEDGYRQDSFVGKDGIEKKYETSLRGKDAVSRIQVDSQGKIAGSLGKSSMTKGDDIRLTIDLQLQKTTEEALQQAVEKASEGGTFASSYGDYTMTYAENAAVGAAVALDVNTGEVLAMASFPDFDPNDFAVSISEEKWQSLQRENEYDPLSPSPMYNIATMTAVQPGSVFKPVTALAAMSCGLDENRYLYDGGYIELGGRTYGCSLWNDSGNTHGYVDLREALEVSCNYYFYDIAAGKDFASGNSLGYNKKITNDIIIEYAEMLGLGRKTGIEINESAGMIPSEKAKTRSVKNSLRNYLLAESETYFVKSTLKNRQQTRKNIEKIVNWTDKDLTLEKIIGKLNKEEFVKKNKVEELASVCKYSYFDQAEWTQGDTFNIAIGQGDNSYTTLQIANYMVSLANGGENSGVTLISGKKDRESKQNNRSLNREDAAFIIDAMTSVTDEKDGSLYRAFASFPYSVAAKTGTAQRAGKISTEDEREYIRKHLHLIAPDITMEQVEAEAERLKKEYPDIYETDSSALRRAIINKSGYDITADDIDRYKESYDSFAWTAALAPSDDPQIAVAVLIVQGKTSSNAAPVVREIIGKYGEISEWEK